MAVDIRKPIPRGPVLAPPSPGPKRGHIGERVALIALEAFVVLTAIWGAVFVVPTIPREWLHKGLIAPFADTTIPALALGVLCGGTALVALIAVLAKPALGALASIVAGVFMVGFELVEIAVVGFTPVLYPTQPPAWLQVIYLVVGSATTLVGLRLWKDETGSYRNIVSAVR